MGVAKAALEASVRYLSAELGPDKQGACQCDQCWSDPHLGQLGHRRHPRHDSQCGGKAPLRRTVTQTEVGNTAAFLLSDLASGISGQTIYVDSGYCINGM